MHSTVSPSTFHAGLFDGHPAFMHGIFDVTLANGECNILRLYVCERIAAAGNYTITCGLFIAIIISPVLDWNTNR